MDEETTPDGSGPKRLDSHARDVPAGEVLFREGDEGSEMFVIQSGEVELSRRLGDTEQVLAVAGAGEFFGEMAIVTGRPRSATAVVVRDARLLVIESRTFEHMLRAKSEIAVRMIQSLAHRLQRANQQVELLLLRNVNHRVVTCLRQMADEELARDVDGQSAIFIPLTVEEFSRRVVLSIDEVQEAIERLSAAGLVLRAEEAGLSEPGFVLPEVGRLLEFLEFLDLKHRAADRGR
jgi:CRP/FNR family transcriptional regulator, cyclic AMP receptor protein